MNDFINALIGKKDINGIDLKEGDRIDIEICKPSAINRERIYRNGVIVYHDAAFCIKEENGQTTPITNFAPACVIKKIENE